MYAIREDTEQPISRKQMEALHHQHMASAKVAEEKGDWVLSESYYQRAEYYLHAMNEPSDSAPIASIRPSVQKSMWPKKTMAHQPGTRTRERSSKQATALPFRGNFLRRNRRSAPLQHPATT